jgi:hypothetical protein
MQAARLAATITRGRISMDFGIKRFLNKHLLQKIENAWCDYGRGQAEGWKPSWQESALKLIKELEKAASDAGATYNDIANAMNRGWNASRKGRGLGD